MKLDTLFRE